MTAPTENQIIKEIEKLFADAFSVNSKGVDSFISDKNFTYVYRSAAGDIHTFSPDAIWSDLSTEVLQSKRFGPTEVNGLFKIIGTDTTEANFVVEDDHVRIDRRLKIQEAVEDDEAVILSQIADFGGGDMLRGTYDVLQTGTVDDSELVNGLSVETAVPSGAVFTDTVYDDTAIQVEVDLNTAKETNVTTNLSETSTQTAVTVVSSDGTDAILASASTSRAGVLTKAKFDEIESATVAITTKRDIVHSFVDPDGVVFAFDNATRTLTYTHPSGFVQFWAGKVFYSIPNGDARLTVTAANATQPVWSYFDIDGQLKYKTTLDWIDVKTVCLGHLAKYSTTHVNPDTSVGGFILTIARWEDCQANHVENLASYLSKGVQVVRGQSIDFTAAIGDTITGYTSASYLSARDFQFWIQSANADAVNWLRYHYDGVDDVGQYNAILSVSLAPTGTPIIVAEDIGLVGTNAIYNLETNGVFSAEICPSNDFVIGQIGIADGGTQNVVALAPQGKYATEGDARAAIEAQEKKLTNNDNIFRDIAIVASYIVKGNLDNGFLDATGDGDAFYMHDIAGQGGGGGGANNQGLDDVIAIDPISDKDATVGSLTATRGAKSGETGPENAAAGVADGGTLVSYDGAKVTESITLTAATGVSFSTNNSHASAVMVIPSEFFVTTQVFADGNTIGSVPSGYEPFATIYCMITENTTGEFYGAYVLGSGLIKISGRSLPIGSYRFICNSYPKQ